MDYGTEIYKGTKIIWDEDHDKRICIFIDDLKEKYPDVSLYSCYEHKGSIKLIFNNFIPLEYREGKFIEVIDGKTYISLSEEYFEDECCEDDFEEELCEVDARDEWCIEESKINK